MARLLEGLVNCLENNVALGIHSGRLSMPTLGELVLKGVSASYAHHHVVAVTAAEQDLPSPETPYQSETQHNESIENSVPFCSNDDFDMHGVASRPGTGICPYFILLGLAVISTATPAITSQFDSLVDVGW